MRRGLVIFAVFAVVVVLAAQPADATALGGNDGDKQIAKAGVFQADDFPAGWRATPPEANKEKVNSSDCPVVKKAGGLGRQRTGRSEGNDFERSGEIYRSVAHVYRTEDAARRLYKALASERLRRCYTRLLEDEVQSRAEEELSGSDVKVELGQRTGSRSYGDESVDFEIKMTVSEHHERICADMCVLIVAPTVVRARHYLRLPRADRQLCARGGALLARRLLSRVCRWCGIGRRRVSIDEFRAHFDRFGGSGRACLEGHTESEDEEAEDEGQARSEHQDAYASDDIGGSANDAAERASDG
jgi:hypothetical protein